jgi:mono/diheme cytochrome c family protein
MIKKLAILIFVVLGLFGVVMLFTYDIIKIDWISFMEIQPSFNPMEDPQPVISDTVPIQGAAYALSSGVMANPITADGVSTQRGAELYKINCVPCHGAVGKGDGVIGTFFKYKPADLTSYDVQQNSDEALFYVISVGVEGRMPPMNENFSVRERWDLVNFIRTLAATTTTP